MLAATAKYPSVLATSARLQISESKTSFFTDTHFCAVLSMVGEREFVNFRKFVNYVHIFAEVLSLLLAEYRLKGGAHTQKTKVRGLIKYIQSSKSG